MARKRKKVRGTTEENKLKLKDPDPTTEEYIYDDVDKFHRSKDKILLDPTKEAEESELEEDEDEEVLAISGSDDDEDSEDDAEDDDIENKKENDGDESESMVSEGDEADDGLPSDKAWGQRKKAFYDADVLDGDIETSDEEAELAAEEEEIEAMTLQKRMAEKLDMDDFYPVSQEEEEENQTKEEKSTKITTDLSKLSKREKLEILSKESPELLPILDEYKAKLIEVKDVYHPLLMRIKNGYAVSEEGELYVKTKHQLLLNYLVNLSFYLALKASKDYVQGHPIIEVLLQHKQLLAELEPLDKKLAPEIHEILSKKEERMTAIKEKSAKTEEHASTNFINVLRSKAETNMKKKKKAHSENMEDSNKDLINPLEYYNKVKSEQEKKKLQKFDISMDVEDGFEEEFDENDKRGITYQIAKNKGMMRKRRKELKNPRVKHKMKFKKATIKRKGQVRDVVREMSRYGGETTGIKASLARSVKIK